MLSNVRWQCLNYSTCKRDCFTDVSLGDVRDAHRLAVIRLRVEGGSANRDSVVLDQDHVKANGVRDELGYEAVLHVSSDLNYQIIEQKKKDSVCQLNPAYFM